MYNNCNCNDDYERIKKRIDEESKKYKQCYIQGPPGPKGEQGIKGDPGPATIRVGSTETVESSEPALVINTGTKEDVILDFKIPKGDKGDKGEQGIQGMQGPKGEQGDKGDIGLKGDKGEKGEPGPTTIRVGSTETVESSEPALVINAGTKDDIILNFKIPKGDKGDKGDSGPRGLPGEIGRTEHIAIDETETIEPGEPAQVMDTFENWVHHLSFLIPKGEKGDLGPVGPQGPTGQSFVSSYGIRYSMTDTQLNLPQATDTVIPLPEKGISFFTEYPDDNSIKIKESGVYLVSYLLCAATNEECSITMSVRANDILQPATSATSEFQAQLINNISGSTIISLQTNDLITLNVKSSKNVNMKFNGSTNAMLSIIKIH